MRDRSRLKGSLPLTEKTKETVAVIAGVAAAWRPSR